MNEFETPAPAPDERLSTVDKLRMLLDITKKISRSLDLEEILNLVMDTLGSLIPYRRGRNLPDRAGRGGRQPVYLQIESDPRIRHQL